MSYVIKDFFRCFLFPRQKGSFTNVKFCEIKFLDHHHQCIKSFFSLCYVSRGGILRVVDRLLQRLCPRAHQAIDTSLIFNILKISMVFDY